MRVLQLRLQFALRLCVHRTVCFSPLNAFSRPSHRRADATPGRQTQTRPCKATSPSVTAKVPWSCHGRPVSALSRTMFPRRRPYILLIFALAALVATHPSSLAVADGLPSYPRHLLTPRVHPNNSGTVHDIFVAPPNEDADPAEEPDPNDKDASTPSSPSYDSDFDHTWIPELIIPPGQWKHYCEQGRILCWHGIPTNFLRDLISIAITLAIAMSGPTVVGLFIWKGLAKWKWRWARRRQEKQVSKRYLDFEVREKRIRRMRFAATRGRGSATGSSSTGAGRPSESIARPSGASGARPSFAITRASAETTPPRPSRTWARRTMIGSVGRGNTRPLTIYGADGQPILPRCSVRIEPGAEAEFGFGAGISRVNIPGPRAMPTATPSSPLRPSDPLLATPAQFPMPPPRAIPVAAPTFAPPPSDPLLATQSQASAPLLASARQPPSPLRQIDRFSALYGAYQYTPAASPPISPATPSSLHVMWPADGSHSQRSPLHREPWQQAANQSTWSCSSESSSDTPPRLLSGSTFNTGDTSGGSPHRDSVLSNLSSASASTRQLLTPEQKRATLRTSWITSAHRDLGLAQPANGARDLLQTAKKHRRLASVFSNSDSPRSPPILLTVPAQAGSTPAASPSARVTFSGAPESNASSEALVAANDSTATFETSLDTLDEPKFSSGTPTSARPLLRDVPAPWSPYIAASISRAPPHTQHGLGDDVATPALQLRPALVSRPSSSRRRTLTDEIADLDPGVLHAFTMRMKFRAMAHDGAAWGWEWHASDDAHTRKQVKKTVDAAKKARTALQGRYRRRGATASGGYAARDEAAISGYDYADAVEGDVDGQVHDRPQSLLNTRLPSAGTRRSRIADTRWTQIENQQGHWSFDDDGPSMGVGVGRTSTATDEKIPQEIRTRLYEMWGFSEAGPFFR